MSAGAVSTFNRLADWLLTADPDSPAWELESRCSGWTNADILIHLACTLRELVEPDSLPAPDTTSIERTNDRQVAAFLTRTAREHIAEYRRLLSAAQVVLADLQSDAMRDQTFDLFDAGVYPAHLGADALVFDHYCHLVHDATLGDALSPLASGLAAEALGVSTGWLIAGIPQMSGPALADALQQSVTLELSGPGGGAWLLDRTDDGKVDVEPITDGGPPAGGAIRSTTEAFMLWGTHRVDWRHTEVRAADDPITAAVLDAIHVY